MRSDASYFPNFTYSVSLVGFKYVLAINLASTEMKLLLVGLPLGGLLYGLLRYVLPEAHQTVERFNFSVI